MTIYESLAYGLPVVCSHGTPWSHIANVSGGFHVPHQLSCYVDAILKISSLSPALRSDFSRNAMNYSYELHTESSSSAVRYFVS